jgi:hypothetical protein
MGNIFTHDRIKLTTGALAPSKGILWGGNALQSITIGRHTPRNPQQAIGYLGIVDYTSGTITSDATLDTILVEASSKAAAVGNSVYKYAGQNITVGSESYVLTSAAVNFSANAAATASFGWLTSGMASYLDIQAQPTPGTGEESNFAVVMGDDGDGIKLVPAWYGTPVMATDTIPVIDATGATVTQTSEIPAGVQSLGFQSTINRDQILDIRSTSPVQFVTTYPIDIGLDLECYCLPLLAADKPQGDALYDPETFRHMFKDLKDLEVQSTNLQKHVATGAIVPNVGNEVYVKAIGLRQTDESEAVQVGRYLQFTLQFTVADLRIPLPAVT